MAPPAKRVYEVSRASAFRASRDHRVCQDVRARPASPASLAAKGMRADPASRDTQAFLARTGFRADRVLQV
jgi:hypothetical protein